MVSMCSCLILGLISSSGELDGIGDVDALLLGVDASTSGSSSSRLGVLEAPPSSKRSGGAIEGLANGGVCTLLLGGLLAVRSEGLRPALPVDTCPGLEPSSWSELGPAL